jgi:hypothetical protein
MVAGPQRRPATLHLNAHIVPVERALLERARVLEEQSRNTDGGNGSFLFLAAEFRALAEELHHW